MDQDYLAVFHDYEYSKAINTPHKAIHDLFIEVYQIFELKKPRFISDEKWELKKNVKAQVVFDNMLVLSDQFKLLLRQFSSS